MTGSSPHPRDDRALQGHPGLPRWVKLLGLGAAVLVIVLVVAMLLAGGQHGPGMHGG